MQPRSVCHELRLTQKHDYFCAAVDLFRKKWIALAEISYHVLAAFGEGFGYPRSFGGWDVNHFQGTGSFCLRSDVHLQRPAEVVVIDHLAGHAAVDYNIFSGDKPCFV